MRSKDELQELMELFDKAVNGDVDACIKVWELIMAEGLDEEGGD